MRASDSSGRQTATAQEEIAPGRESRQDAAPTGVFLEGRNAIVGMARSYMWLNSGNACAPGTKKPRSSGRGYLVSRIPEWKSESDLHVLRRNLPVSRHLREVEEWFFIAIVDCVLNLLIEFTTG